jgi:hypothetical protein
VNSGPDYELLPLYFNEDGDLFTGAVIDSDLRGRVAFAALPLDTPTLVVTTSDWRIYVNGVRVDTANIGIGAASLGFSGVLEQCDVNEEKCMLHRVLHYRTNALVSNVTRRLNFEYNLF